MLPVVLIAGGLATRMRPVTEKIPKSMIDVCGKPFIHYQLELLRANSVEHVILCIGHLGFMIEEYLGSGEKYGLKVEYSYDGDKLLGTGGAVKKVEDRLTDAFFILYGDSYLELDYKQIEKAYLESNKQGLMTVFKNDDRYDTSNVVFKNNQLLSYSKTNKTSDMNYIDYGLGILHKDSLKVFPHSERFDIAEAYEQLAKSNNLLGYEVFERFYEIGSKEGLDDLVSKFSASGESK